ncbi:MAG: alpha-galactosidase [Verrucomicrobia bacterium]|nr:alpha-galactosidase [Verrucomicrobiota bacterium]
MRTLSFCCAFGLVLHALASPSTGVEFPGPLPGKPEASQKDGSFTLENAVLAATWEERGGTIRPARLINKLTGGQFDQTGAELFRLALEPARSQTNGIRVAVRLLDDHVVALASRDGVAWVELASFPRADFPGDPKLVRLGKMNLKAQPKDNPGDLGSPGEGLIADIEPASMATKPFSFKARAHQAAMVEYPFPSGTRQVSCRIDKGTDQGMSWSPALALVWEEGKRFLLVGVRERTPVFNVTTAAGERIQGASLLTYPALDRPASSFRLASPLKPVPVAAQPRGVRLAEKSAGMAFEAELVTDAGLRARWHAELRENANYIRQTIELTSPQATVPLYGVELADVRVLESKTIGSVPGCPVAAGGMFFGVEMPGAQNALSASGARIGFGCKLELSPAQSYTFGAVAGVAPEGQLRRAFLCYIERERARPSKPFLHYNCWYDLGFGVDEKGLLDVVAHFNDELAVRRGVPVLSYLADDGWDDPNKGLWVENSAKFPDGFKGLAPKMAKNRAHLGIWISPLGGYGGAQERTDQARKMGIIPETSQLDLSYPAYKKWFQERCLQLVREDGVNIFKWDRAGEGVSPHFMALLDVARTLRLENPEVFINVTVGTWPSPFWLNHVDSTWRNGSGDVGWTGKGREPSNKFDREKWLTFRDGYCRQLFVQKSPLYPLNSVMHHGVVHGREFQGGSTGKSNPPDLKNEARSYFANGASLQELYLTPSMMTSNAWNQVAEAARWAHANADVLVDSHWMGGDPLKLEAYGYAAWNKRKGTLMLRNPDDRPQAIALDAATVFELPAGAPKRYILTSPYKDQRLQKIMLNAGQPETITLESFEVLVFDASGE